MSNILPLQQKKDIKKMIYLRYAIVGTICIGGVVAIAIMLLIPTYILLHKQLAVATVQKNTAVSQSANRAAEETLTTIQKNIGELENKLVFNTTTPLYETAKKIIINPFEGVVINSFDLTQSTKSLHLVGVARDRATLESFARYLEVQPGVRIVESPLSNFIKSKQLPFTLTVVL